MQSTGAKVALAVVALAVVVVLFVVLQGNSRDNSNSSTTVTTRAGDTTTETSKKAAEPTTPVITLRNNEPVDGVRKLTFSRGDRIRFDVTSNTETAVHVHGYDIEKEVAPGHKARFDFKADIDGVFDVEEHATEEQIALLRVKP